MFRRSLVPKLFFGAKPPGNADTGQRSIFRRLDIHLRISHIDCMGGVTSKFAKRPLHRIGRRLSLHFLTFPDGYRNKFPKIFFAEFLYRTVKFIGDNGQMISLLL